MSLDTLVQTSHLRKRFGREEVLRGLTMTVPEGACYALLGANGAGKTTTLKLLMNLIEPTAGSATVLGVDTQRLSPEVFARIGYVSESQVLPQRLRVGQYLDYLRPFYPRWDRELETTLCRRLQLPLDRKIGALSHGMRIKTALACALPYRPQLLVLDEPFSGLDPLVREELMEDLLLHAGETTLLISSHELAELESVVTHVGFLDAGSMLLEDSMTDLNSRIRRLRVTLDRPAAIPPQLPTQWLRAQAFGTVLTFVDTQYHAEETAERLRMLLGPVRHIDAEPMPLREVFTTLARAARDGGKS
jgi:ABC-2 type transport system ATP-binding protein